MGSYIIFTMMMMMTVASITYHDGGIAAITVLMIAIAIAVVAAAAVAVADAVALRLRLQ